MPESRAELIKLRRRAEDLLGVEEHPFEDMPPNDIRALVHDLRVHQIELEMQNDELRNTQQILNSTRQEIVHSRDQFMHLYNNAPVGYLTVDDNSLIHQCNDTFLNFLSLEHKDVIGRSLAAFIDPRDRDSFIARYRAFYKQPDNKNLEVRLRPPRGNPVCVELEGRRDMDIETSESTEQDRALVIVHDIEKRKQVEIQLAAALARVQASNNELQQFAYAVSHDLREPLRMITQYLQLIESRYAPLLDEKGHQFFAFATDGAQRMNRMIEDILDFSRINQQSPQMSMVDLNQVFAEATQNLKAAIGERTAELTVGDLPFVRGCHAELVGLFQNLIGNALKYCPPIRIPSIHIEAQAVENMNEWLISVADNGIGIAPEFRERVFEIFQRLHSREQYEGTGIGLALCRKIVEHHGGRIWVDAPAPQGSTFYFTLSAS